MRIELIVLAKGKRYILLDGKMVPFPYPTVKNIELMNVTRNLLVAAGLSIDARSILFVQIWSSTWPSSPVFTYKRWLERIDLHLLAEEISVWRQDLGDELAMDRLHNRYQAWREEQENRHMENLL